MSPFIFSQSHIIAMQVDWENPKYGSMQYRSSAEMQVSHTRIVHTVYRFIGICMHAALQWIEWHLSLGIIAISPESWNSNFFFFLW